jgi:hypothetical protein
VKWLRHRYGSVMKDGDGCIAEVMSLWSSTVSGSKQVAAGLRIRAAWLPNSSYWDRDLIVFGRSGVCSLCGRFGIGVVQRSN